MDHSVIDRLVGLRIKEARDAVKLTPEALAHEMDLSLDDLNRYETGNARINAETLCQFSKCLDQPISYFFDQDSSATPNITRQDLNFLSSYIGLETFDRKRVRDFTAALIVERKT